MSGAPEISSPSSFFVVSALSTCPHAQEAEQRGLFNFTNEMMPTNCSCSTEEKWICLFCGNKACSTYMQGHAKLHFDCKTSCCLAFSVLDSSVWCYKCNSYIDFYLEKSLWTIYSALYFSIHGEEPELPRRKEEGYETNPG